MGDYEQEVLDKFTEDYKQFCRPSVSSYIIINFDETHVTDTIVDCIIEKLIQCPKQFRKLAIVGLERKKQKHFDRLSEKTGMLIRNEKPDDYRIVEELIKKTFWNLSEPGCKEHYLVHQVRKSEEYIPELDFVLEEDGKIIGHIIYVKAKLLADDGEEKEILSFGPFTIHPDYQRKGYGRKLLEHSFKVAKEMGYDTVAIWGNPENYACYGFKNCKRFHVRLEENVFPVALMVRELEEGVLADKSWKFIESPAHQMDESGFEEFDKSFEQMEMGYSYTQELFYIYSRSNVLR